MLWLLSPLLGWWYFVCKYSHVELTGAVSGHGQPTMSHNWFQRFEGVDQLDLALALYSGFWTYGGILYGLRFLTLGWDNVSLFSSCKCNVRSTLLAVR